MAEFFIMVTEEKAEPWNHPGDRLWINSLSKLKGLSSMLGTAKPGFMIT